MMRRVSSRQRLVSWDAFDATVGEEYDILEGLVDLLGPFRTGVNLGRANSADDEGTSLNSLKRKRLLAIDADGSFQLSPNSANEFSTDGVPIFANVVPIMVCDETEGHDAPDDQIQWNALPPEVRLNVMQFLNVESLLKISAVDRSHRQLLTEDPESMEAIWKPALRRLWPWTLNVLSSRNQSHGQIYNALDSGNYCGVLLSMAAASTPTQIDASLFEPTRWSRSLRTYRPRRNASSELCLLPPGMDQASPPSLTVQFTGVVGLGDRCIRADQPLPRPQLLKRYKTIDPMCAASILQRFRNCSGRSQVFKPFVAPFVDADNRVNLTPRLVSYFEVSILPKPADFAPEHRPLRIRHNRFNERDAATTTAPECVAIGLATSSFCLHSRMPGWDSHSYGYHGDDGGIFHATGSMLKEYGAHFGMGDTVGCGVDYHRRAIFYTLNGSFLGYAFELGKPATLMASSHHGDSFLHEDLYPVIGLDTNYPVACNFGTKDPFQFDLAGMIAQHKTVVQQAMMHPQHS
jgi:SPRY domain